MLPFWQKKKLYLLQNKMHFKLDENIPLQLAKQIETQGYSVSSVFSEKISGTSDKKLLNVCVDNDYVLITLDKDFINSRKHKGIILLRLRSQGVLAVSDAFEKLRKKMNLLQTKDVLVIVENEHIRIRR